MLSKNQLRASMRQRRQALMPQEAERCAQQMAEWIVACDFFKNSHRIAAYAAVRGEMDPRFLIEAAWQLQKEIYLPIITEMNTLEFYLYTPHSHFSKNRFGILEPEKENGKTIPLESLDLILMPLVAFDAHGNRLGQGAGFYDRTLGALFSSKIDPAPMATPPAPAATLPATLSIPFLCGLAYSFQKVPQLAVDSWDVPLDAVATERGIEYKITKNSK